MQNGTYAPLTPEQNIRSFERFPVSRENIVIAYKPYDRLGYGEESKFSRENSINEFKRIVQLNKENPFKWMPIYWIGGEGSTPVTPSFSWVESWPSSHLDLLTQENISLINQEIKAVLDYAQQYLY